MPFTLIVKGGKCLLCCGCRVSGKNTFLVKIFEERSSGQMVEHLATSFKLFFLPYSLSSLTYVVE